MWHFLASSIAVFVALLTALPAHATPERAPAEIEARVEAFIREDYIHASYHDPDRVRRSYSDPLEFWFGETRVPLREVLRAKRTYLQTWPDIEGRIVDGSLAVWAAPNRPDVFLVRFVQEYRRARRGLTETGAFENEVLVRFEGDTIRIVGENGRVLKPR